MVSSEYDPNEIVRALHGFAHFSSSNKFDILSKGYQISVGLLGGLFTLVLLSLAVFFMQIMWCSPIRPRNVTRYKWRFTSLAFSLLGMVGVALGILMGWQQVSSGMEDVSSAMAGIQGIANEFRTGGVLLKLSCNELLDEMNHENIVAECPSITQISDSFAEFFVPLTSDFETTTSKFPTDILNLRDGKVAVASTVLDWLIAFPIMLGGGLIIGVLSALCNLSQLTQCTKITVFLSLLLGSIVLGAQISSSVAGSDLCVDANNNTISLVNHLFDNTTTSAATYAATCDGELTLLEPLHDGQAQLLQLINTVTDLDDCSDDAKDSINERAGISWTVMNTILTRDICPDLNSYWNRFLHDGTCDGIIPGLVVLSACEFVCLIVFMLGAVTSHVIVESMRRSLVFSKESDPLAGGIGKADTVVVPAQPSYQSYTITED